MATEEKKEKNKSAEGKEQTEIEKVLAGLKLNPKQLAFCEEYILTINATKSYQKIYDCDYETAKASGPRLLANVRKYINLRMSDIYENLGITPERILKEYARIAYFDPQKLLNEDGTLKQMSEIDEDTRAAIAGVEVENLFEGRGKDRECIGTVHKLKIVDKKGALDSVGKHRQMFIEKVEVEHKGEVNLIVNGLKRI